MRESEKRASEGEGRKEGRKEGREGGTFRRRRKAKRKRIKEGKRWMF